MIQFIHSPPHLHLATVHRIIHYLKGTSQRGLFFSIGTSKLTGYSDADWTRYLDTH